MASLTSESNRITVRRSLRSLTAFIAFACMTTAAQTLLWEDNFDSGSAPNPQVWTAETGTGSQYGLNGWGNNELQSYTGNADNVRVENGNLVITAKRSGNNFTSARIKTQNKLTLQYGTVEARIKTPDLADGLWPAFWTLGDLWQQGEGWAECGEIDIMEMGNVNAINAGKVNSRVGSAAHWIAYPNNVNYSKSKDMNPDIDGTFVTYRMEWTPFKITTYINDQYIWDMDISGIQEFQKPHFLILNLAVGGNYTGITSANGITALASGESADYVIDYIRIYDNGHTILGGSSLTAPVPPVFTSDPIIRPNAVEDSAFSATIAGSAIDLNAGDTLTYSKVPGSGPSWLTVAPGGALSGTPGNDDIGLNSWTVEVSDGVHSPVSATLEITVDNVNDDPVFTTDPVIMPNGVINSGYNGTLAGSATDVDAGDTLSYFKWSGPVWLNVSTDGTLSGTPDNTGLNSWTVFVRDGSGRTDTATLQIMVDNELTQPTLNIQVSGSNLEVLWSAAAAGFNLYGTTNLTPSAAWSAVTNSPSIQGDDWMVTIPLDEAPPFFRLQNP